MQQTNNIFNILQGPSHVSTYIDCNLHAYMQHCLRTVAPTHGPMRTRGDTLFRRNVSAARVKHGLMKHVVWVVPLRVCRSHRSSFQRQAAGRATTVGSEGLWATGAGLPLSSESACSATRPLTHWPGTAGVVDRCARLGGEGQPPHDKAHAFFTPVG